MNASFFFEPLFRRQGPRVIVVIGDSWSRAVLGSYGITTPPVFTRPAMPGESDKLPGGEPYAWCYKSPIECVKDEARWLSAEQLEILRGALVDAGAELEPEFGSARSRIERQDRVERSGAAA